MKKAFTLAEVIVTLFIIALIASMTVPALLADRKKHNQTTKKHKPKIERTIKYDYVFEE